MLLLEWPAACLINARWQLHDGSKWYVASFRLGTRLEVLLHTFLETMATDGGAGPGARRVAQSLMLMLPEVPVQLIARCKAAFVGGAFPHISLVHCVQDDLGLALSIKSRVIRWVFRSSFLTAAAGGRRSHRRP